MYIILVGGGKVGYYLIKTLLQNGHEVAVIEKDDKRCTLLSESFNVLVINGDGTDIETLRAAKAENADFMAAVTGKDEENLVACQLVKRHFGVTRTIARVNNPKNQSIFSCLGVDATVSSTARISQMIEQELAAEEVKTLLTFDRGDMVLVEAKIKGDSPTCGVPIRRMGLPDECILVSVIRSGKILFPKGETVLEQGDEVIALTNSDTQISLKNMLAGGRR